MVSLLISGSSHSLILRRGLSQQHHVHHMHGSLLAWVDQSEGVARLHAKCNIRVAELVLAKLGC